MTSTPPSGTVSDAPRVVLHHQPLTGTWDLALAHAGPAGALTLRLPAGVVISTDRLLPDQPLRLRFCCDTRGHWPEGIRTLAALLFGVPAAQALNDKRARSVDYQPPVGPRRQALLRLIGLGAALHELPALAHAQAMHLALAAGDAGPHHPGEHPYLADPVPVLRQAGLQFAAATAHLLRQLPDDDSVLTDDPRALVVLAGLRALVHQELGADLRLSAEPTTATSGSTDTTESLLGLEPPAPATQHGRVLVGDAGAPTGSPLRLLDLDAMRLPAGVRRHPHEPAQPTLTRLGDESKHPWLLQMPWPDTLSVSPWVRVGDEHGHPVLHVRTQIHSGHITAELPDLQAVDAGPLWVELLADPLESVMSVSNSQHIAATRRAVYALEAGHDQARHQLLHELWSSSGRAWDALGEHGKALIAFDLAARALGETTNRALATRVQRARRARRDVAAFDLYRKWLSDGILGSDDSTRPLPTLGQPPTADILELADLQHALDRWVHARLAQLFEQISDPNSADLATLISQVDVAAAIATPTDSKLRLARGRTRLALALAAWRAGDPELAHGVYTQVLDDYDHLGNDPASARLLSELGRALQTDGEE